MPGEAAATFAFVAEKHYNKGIVKKKKYRASAAGKQTFALCAWLLFTRGQLLTAHLFQLIITIIIIYTLATLIQ